MAVCYQSYQSQTQHTTRHALPAVNTSRDQHPPMGTHCKSSPGRLWPPPPPPPCWCWCGCSPSLSSTQR